MRVVFLLAALAAAPALAADQPYDGVVPGAKTKATPRKKGPYLVTWVGFQKSDGGARVFVRVSSGIHEVTQETVGDEVVAHIPDVRVDTKNNTRPLDTRYFGTDVTRVWARDVKKGVDVHVKLAKAGAQPKLSTAPAPEGDGSVMVYLDF
jgi:hypothetical protein